MTSFTFADNKLGGRITAACDAIGASHLNRAAGIFAEIADQLYQEATTAAMAEPGDEWAVPLPEPAKPMAPARQVSATDLQSCARGAHQYGPPNEHNWRECLACGMTSIVDGLGGAVDMGVCK